MPINIEDSKTVRIWLDGLQEQSGLAREDALQRVAVLAEFCRRVEKEPDQIIGECLREVDGAKKIRAKGRQFYVDEISGFEQQLDGAAAEKRRKGNYVRSFLIHNGVLLQTSPLS